MKKFNEVLVTCVKSEVAARNYPGIRTVAEAIGLSDKGLRNIMSGDRNPSRPTFLLLSKRYPELKGLLDEASLKHTSRTINGKKPKTKITVKRVKRVATAGLMRHAPSTKKKPSTLSQPRVSLSLVSTVLALHKDKKALFHIQGLLITAAADGLGITELQELLGNAA